MYVDVLIEDTVRSLCRWYVKLFWSAGKFKRNGFSDNWKNRAESASHMLGMNMGGWKLNLEITNQIDLSFGTLFRLCFIALLLS